MEVTATNASGSATLTIPVTAAAAAPEAVGTPDPLSLPAGGAEVEIDVTDLFTPTAVSYSYGSRNPGIVSADLRGSILTLTPASAGTTTVERHGDQRARIGQPDVLRDRDGYDGSAGGEDPGAGFPDRRRRAGGSGRRRRLHPRGVHGEGHTTGSDTVATVAVSGTVITITPVGEGTTRVYVDVSNSSRNRQAEDFGHGGGGCERDRGSGRGHLVRRGRDP